ncbi:hypothetical protein MSNKSG1_00788 [Marinobacter santoriniensis NKSG1]|uniref:Lipoprotein n=1 Tax=Marinobacter santoriniensis NKSG1 TaxID=1288826 RepID=M7CVF4_9GAMM|nr:hypothetical protein MSNKSG1_00788 [Marinobacter santoriniensis NKSG1]
MKYFFIACIATTLLSGCAHTITLKPDSKWHTVWSANRQDSDININVQKDNHCDEPALAQDTQIRLIRLTHFMDLDNLPDSREETEEFYAGTEHSGVPLRLLDSGPLDMSQNGSTYQIRITKGMALVSRTKEKCSVLLIEKPKKRDDK